MSFRIYFCSKFTDFKIILLSNASTILHARGLSLVPRLPCVGRGLGTRLQLHWPKARVLVIDPSASQVQYWHWPTFPSFSFCIERL